MFAGTSGVRSRLVVLGVTLRVLKARGQPLSPISAL